jgi:hypothetical protein
LEIQVLKVSKKKKCLWRSFLGLDSKMFPADSQITGRTYLLFILRENGQLDNQGGASRQAGEEEQLDKHRMRSS